MFVRSMGCGWGGVAIGDVAVAAAVASWWQYFTILRMRSKDAVFFEEVQCMSSLDQSTGSEKCVESRGGGILMKKILRFL